MIICGWGNYPKVDARVHAPKSIAECLSPPSTASIARGMGRSYGDSSIGADVIQTTLLDHFLSFDNETGLITVEAGITFKELLRVVVPKGWFVPVSPGTSYVTVGGAIASDVHGKNHHAAGTFGQHVVAMTMVLGTGEVVTTSPYQLPDLFQATCGGMGLTGLIISATIQLRPLASSTIQQTTLKSSCLEEVCEQFDTHLDSTYSVAWIDCLAKGRHLGRSVLMLGEHAESGPLMFEPCEALAVPFHTPATFLNPISMKMFNLAYFSNATHKKEEQVQLPAYFYPLDSIGQWNKIYGKSGFVQYQCVVPKEDGVKHLKILLNEISAVGSGSFLAVLKQFGPANNHLLSFPKEGYTLALDFKMTASTIRLLHLLDDILLSMGGRVYLTKDASMKASTFKSSYPAWEAFEAVRHKYGAIGKFASAQSKRLGLS